MPTSTVTQRDRLRWTRESAVGLAHHLRAALEGDIDASPCALAELRDALEDPDAAGAMREFLAEHHSDEWGVVAEDLEDLYVAEVLHELRRD